MGKAPKKEGQNKKKDATIEFFGDAREEKSDERLDSAKRPFLRSRCRRLDGAALRRRKRHCRRRPTMTPLPRPNGQKNAPIRNSKPNCPARFACCPWKGPRVK